MALKSRTWECPDCAGQFTTLMDDRDGPPRFCQCCGADMAADIEPIPNFSRVRKPTDGSLDRVYRQMETASEARAQAAAEMMGTSVAEQSNIKITNMKDNPYEGETSFIAPQANKVNSPPPSNVAVMPGVAGLAAAQQVRAQGGSVGNKVLDGFRSSHHQRAAQMQRAGQIGSYAGK